MPKQAKKNNITTNESQKELSGALKRVIWFILRPFILVLRVLFLTELPSPTLWVYNRFFSKPHHHDNNVQQIPAEILSPLILEVLPAPNGDHQLSCKSIKGVRESNQDTATAMQVKSAGGSTVGIAAVADGVGGQAGGDIASNLAIKEIFKVIISFLLLIQGDEGIDPVAILKQAIHKAQQKIAQLAAQNPNLTDMATTLAVVLSINRVLYFASIGDSRAYLVSQGKLQCLTKDDSLVQAMVDECLIEPNQATDHPLEHVIMKSLSIKSDTSDVRVGRITLLPDDLVIVASDGFWKFGENSILETVEQFKDDTDITDLGATLVAKARKNDSDDNISVAILQCTPEIMTAQPEYIDIVATV